MIRREAPGKYFLHNSFTKYRVSQIGCNNFKIILPNRIDYSTNEKFIKVKLLNYSLGEIMFGTRGCVKSLLPPAAAEYYFERHVIFMISRSEIMKMTCLSKHNSARSAVKNLFTQPHTK